MRPDIRYVRVACNIDADRYPVHNASPWRTPVSLWWCTYTIMGVRAIGVGIRAHFFVSYHAIYETLIEVWSGKKKSWTEKRQSVFERMRNDHASSFTLHPLICKPDLYVDLYVHTYIYYIRKPAYFARVYIHAMYMCTFIYTHTCIHVAMCWRINRTFAFPASTVVPLYVPSLPGVTHCVQETFADLPCFFLYFVPLTPGRILRVRRIYVVTFGRDPSVRFCADDVVAIEQRRVKRQTQNEVRVDFHIGWVLPRVALTTCNFYFRQAITDIDGFC